MQEKKALMRKGTPLASRVAQGVSGPSSSCVWNPRVFADDARALHCPFVLCLPPQGPSELPERRSSSSAPRRDSAEPRPPCGFYGLPPLPLTGPPVATAALPSLCWALSLVMGIKEPTRGVRPRLEGTFVDHDGYSISSKGSLPTVVDIMVI